MFGELLLMDIIRIYADDRCIGVRLINSWRNSLPSSSNQCGPVLSNQSNGNTNNFKNPLLQSPWGLFHTPSPVAPFCEVRSAPIQAWQVSGTEMWVWSEWQIPAMVFLQEPKSKKCDRGKSKQARRRACFWSKKALVFRAWRKFAVMMC